MRQGKELDTRFVIFVVISALFIATIYSSSTSVVFGETSCIILGSKAACVSDDDMFGGLYICEEQKDETWKCEKVKASANVPPGLSDALDDAIGPAGPLQEGGVLEDPTTTGPKLGHDVLPKGGGVLEQQTENNMTFSKSNVPFPPANDSDDNTNSTFALLQSDVENDMAVDKTGEIGVEEEQDESEESDDTN
jgi:hypothetical protein